MRRFLLLTISLSKKESLGKKKKYFKCSRNIIYRCRTSKKFVLLKCLVFTLLYPSDACLILEKSMCDCYLMKAIFCYLHGFKLSTALQLLSWFLFTPIHLPTCTWVLLPASSTQVLVWVSALIKHLLHSLAFFLLDSSRLYFCEQTITCWRNNK